MINEYLLSIIVLVIAVLPAVALHNRMLTIGPLDSLVVVA